MIFNVDEIKKLNVQCSSTLQFYLARKKVDFATSGGQINIAMEVCFSQHCLLFLLLGSLGTFFHRSGGRVVEPGWPSKRDIGTRRRLE